MAQPKISSVDVGGVEVQLSAGQLKAAQPVIKALKEIKLLKDQIVHLDKEQMIINKKFEGHEDTMSEYFHNKQEALTKIIDIYKMMGKKFDEQEAYNKKLEEEAAKQDKLKQKSAWQLLYWGTLGAVFLLMTSNSKVLSHFIDILGSSLGFVLDMVLIPAIPWIISLVSFFFELGKAILGLPEPIRQLIAVIALLTGAVILVGLGEVALGILGIGTAAETAAGAAGVGKLTWTLGLLSKTWVIGLELVLLGAAWAVLQAYGDWLMGKAKTGDMNAGLAYDVGASWGGSYNPTDGGMGTAARAQKTQGVQTVTINNHIDGDLIGSRVIPLINRTQMIQNNIGGSSW